MFKKLLVPLDGTPRAEAALHLAAMLARCTGGELVLLRVLDSPDGQGEADARRDLASLSATLDPDLRAEVAIALGEAAEQIVGQVQARGADLIVMATRGRAGIRRALFGSVAERVLHSSPVPVMLLERGEEHVAELETLLVPVDETPGALVALAHARVLAEASGAKIVLLEVVAPLPRYAAGWNVAPHWETEKQARAAQYVQQLAQPLRGAGLAVDGRVEVGPVAPTIAAIADQVGASLIVMSTHALTGPARAMLGSVADAVLHRGSHPVLLIHQETIEQAPAASEPPANTP